MRNKLICCLFLVFAGWTASGTIVSAAENPLGLDDQNHYDIYIAGYGDALTVLKSVDILAVKEISGVSFLVVRTDTFNAKRSEGLIAFFSIRAILPSLRATLDVISADINATSKMKFYTPQ